MAITKIRGLNVNTAKQDERRSGRDRRSEKNRRMRPKLWSQAAAKQDGSGLIKRTVSDRRQNGARRKSETREVTVSPQSAVKLDDRYVKVGVPSIIWIVCRFLKVADPVPHVLLVREGVSNRHITLSIPALQDTSIYKKIEVNPPTD